MKRCLKLKWGTSTGRVCRADGEVVGSYWADVDLWQDGEVYLIHDWHNGWSEIDAATANWSPWYVKPPKPTKPIKTKEE